MRKSKIETAETRQRIVEAAAGEFRRSGVHAAGVADIMAAAGLTHGGFYRHFGSKDDLVAEVCGYAMKGVVERCETAASEAGGGGELNAILASYLSPDHRDSRTGGCPLAGFGCEIAHADAVARDATTSGLEDLLEVLAKRMKRRSSQLAQGDAILALSAMVGAITLSRIVTDAALSNTILAMAKEGIAGRVAR